MYSKSIKAVGRQRNLGLVFDENAQEMYCNYCRKFPHLSDRKDALTRGELKIYALMDLSYTINTGSTCYVSSIGLWNLMIPRQMPALHRPLLTPQ
jgi:hypothetical protein